MLLAVVIETTYNSPQMTHDVKHQVQIPENKCWKLI